MPTIDYFKSHPLRLAKPQTHLTIGQLRAAEKATVVSPKIHPTAGAYIHYGGVELADMLSITKPSIPDAEMTELASLWYQSCGIVAKQLLFYTCMICSKEMRHGSSGKCGKAFSGWQHANLLGMPDAMGLCAQISDGGSYTAHLDNHPDINAYLYMLANEQQFRHGGWSGAFGGKKWADISIEIVRYLAGESSAMIAADRCWTLVHNTGPIFNKGFYFEYHDNDLMNVLEAQASTTVFDLGEPQNFLSHSPYQHSTSSAFAIFAHMATKAIQSVKPDYKMGQGGGVNSDGTKPTNTGLGGTPKGAKSKGTILGSYAFAAGARGDA